MYSNSAEPQCVHCSCNGDCKTRAAIKLGKTFQQAIMDTTLFAVALLNNVQMYSQEKKKTKQKFVVNNSAISKF